jgi:uncharacterized caspase-like protein
MLWLGLPFEASAAILRFNIPQTALIIGNSQYEVGKLSHSVNNATSIAKALKDKGFEVILETDLTSRQMDDAIHGFKKRLYAKKGIGLFYFFGYARQVDGKNYLLPINNAQIKDELDVKYKAIPVALVLEKMQNTHNDFNLIMLDAVLDTPYLDSRYKSGKSGLANVKVPTGGAIIGYATKPGLTTYYPGLYTKHLIKAIQTGGRIEDVFMQVLNNVKRESGGKQIPGYQSSLKEPYCFGGCGVTQHALVVGEKKTKRGSKTKVTQHALVVGINHYQHASKNYLSNIKGAVNDAIVIRDALRQIKVRLPDKRVLLNNQATRVAFIRAWLNMLKQAKPGDTLIVTFSGHGGQQTDTAPIDEEDGKDETLLFHDFNPFRP